MKSEKIFVCGKKFYIHPVFDNHAASKDGEITNIRLRKPFRGTISNSGYLRISVTSKEKIRKTYSAHRFVFECIKGPIPEGFEINHIDQDKKNNSISNLELVTHKQNIELAQNKKVIAINLETKEEKIFISITIAAKELGINRGNISSVCRQRKHHNTAKSRVNGQKYSFRYSDSD